MTAQTILAAGLIALLWASGIHPPEATRAPQEAPGQDTHAVYSPDGERIAFISNRVGVADGRPINFEVYVMELATREQRRLTFNQDFESGLAWSPDGRSLAFQSHRDGNDEIYVMGVDGSGQRNLTHTEASEHGGSWSPDGSRIAFRSDRDGDSEIYVMDPDGAQVRQITHNDASDNSPAWSPDGSRIAFVSNRDGNDDVYVMNADGSGVRRLTDAPLMDWSPVWSPDGKTLAVTYGDWETDEFGLYLVDVDDGGRRLLRDATDSGNTTWSPDGRYIIFGAEVEGDGDLYRLDLETGEEERLTSG